MIKRAALLGVMVSVAAFNVMAVELDWDADPDAPGIQNGAGAWNLTGSNWWDGSVNAVYSGTYGAAAPDIVFGNGADSAGAVTVSGAIYGRNLVINSGGCLFQGDTLNFDDGSTGSGRLTLNATGATTTFNNVLTVKQILFTAANQTLLLNKGNNSGFLYSYGSVTASVSGDIAANSRTSAAKLSGGQYNSSNFSVNIGDTVTDSGGLAISAGGRL
ncbi:MAG: hypothetical protein LBD30_07325, partial [Verrucomicrobiales bacterium]|nr:hypothetical protein [Verrucomicrobiales bacterium]